MLWWTQNTDTSLTFWDNLGRGPEQQVKKVERTFLILECVGE